MAGWFSRQGSNFKDYSKKVVGNQEIQNNHQIIRDALARLMGWRKREVREETFANAVARLKMSEADIHDARMNFVFRFYLFFALLLIDVAFMAWSIAHGSWASLMPGAGFFMMALALVFNASFRAYQVTRRELVGVGQWWQDPDAWWPTWPTKKGKRPGGGNGSSRNTPSRNLTSRDSNRPSSRH